MVDPAFILTFLEKNILLVVVCAASGAMLIWPSLGRFFTGGAPEIGAHEAVQLINRREAVVLDVRDEAEYTTAHIPNARHIPDRELKTRLKELDKFKNRPIVVSCKGGLRATGTVSLLRKSGFKEVFALRGGVAAWQQASMPVEKGT